MMAHHNRNNTIQIECAPIFTSRFNNFVGVFFKIPMNLVENMMIQ